LGRFFGLIFLNDLGLLFKKNKMAKVYTFPTILDDVLQLRLSKLKEFGYLHGSKQGVLKWGDAAKISIAVSILPEKKYLELDYNYRGQPRKYRIEIVSMPSNLGRGEVLYFLCPQTMKRCRVLYCVRGYFLHREAFPDAMYKKQTLSKSGKRFRATIADIFKVGELNDELNKKHRKTHYKGRKTKRIIRIEKEFLKVCN
jgi:hypothetical protein